MKIRNKTQLERLLSNATQKEVPRILDQWMYDSEWGTEVEACKLIQFIMIWDKLLNIKMKSRDKRTAMVKAGITCRVLAHFTGLDRKGATFKAHSIELLSYGLYGPDGMPRDQVTNERLNDQIVHDALSTANFKKIESVSKASMRQGVDRTTVRAIRLKKEYSEGVDVTVQVLNKIKEKRDL